MSNLHLMSISPALAICASDATAIALLFNMSMVKAKLVDLLNAYVVSEGDLGCSNLVIRLISSFSI